MRVTIYQPQYFPRLHYFNRVFSSNIFVILDSAQYTKSLVHLSEKQRQKSYQADTPIKLPNGEYFLTIPVKKSGGLLPINQTQIDYTHHWVVKHLNTIRSAYGKAAFFSQIFPQVTEILLQKYQTLAEIDIKTIIFGISQILGFDLKFNQFTLGNLNERLKGTNFQLKRVIVDSQTGVKRPKGAKKGTEWTAAICKSLKAREYLHGQTAIAGYMDLNLYKDLGITPVTQNWQCPKYYQQFQDRVGFLPNLSILDLLFNVDKKKAFKIIMPN